MHKLKILLPLLFIGFWLGAQRFPDPMSPPRLVNDFADILSRNQEAALEQKLLRYTDTTSTEIAVITVKSLNGEEVNLYAAELGEDWGVGRKGKDNGLVLLVAPNERQVAIQNGYGLEEYLTDANARLIIENYILPQFKKGDYYAGLNEGTDQIFALLSGNFEGKPNRRSGKRKFPPLLILIVIAIIFTVFRNRRGGGRGGYRGGGVWIGGMGGGFGGGGSSFGGGGGFGGFGGGSFGGGGASGSW